MKLMRLLVMFDLPVKTKRDRREANHFRTYLLQKGYLMLQYSVYYRILSNMDKVRELEHSMQSSLPTNGSVIITLMTEKQFENMKFMVGNLPHNDDKVNTHQMSLF